MNKETLQDLRNKLVKPIVPAAVGIVAVIGGFVDGGMTKSAAEKTTNNPASATSGGLNNETPNTLGRPLQAVLVGLSLIVLSIGLDNLQQSRREQQQSLESTNT